ncbi:MAG: YerC/YecD family TrpR-related protein [Lachnospiraceae bacterium]|nr:YerC/YecD family TrpR-related protein [Lachnospiraceae bacterium]
MNKKIKNEMTDGLFQAVLSLENLEECYAFFEDVCTINEIQSLAQRYEVARLLREKKTYLEIAQKTGASTATISRVNRSLNYGNDAYDMVFQRMEQKKEQKKEP